MAAPRTLINVPAERRRSAEQDGVENFLMYPGEPIPAAIEERVSRGADDIGHLQRWPRHLFCGVRTSFASKHRQRVQRAGDGIEMTLRDVEIDRGLLEVMVAQQELDGA